MSTWKQTKTAKIMMENKGISTSKAMILAGYSPKTAKNPQNVTRSKGFRQIWGKTFTPEYLRKHHAQLMNLRTVHKIIVDPAMTEEEAERMLERKGFEILALRKWTETRKDGSEYEKAILLFVSPDGLSKKAALDMAYKITGDYAAVKIAEDDPFENMTEEELDEKIAQREYNLERWKKFRGTAKKQE